MKLFISLILFFCFTAAMAQEQRPARLLLLNGKYLEVYSLNDSSYVPLQYQYDANYYKKERIRLRAARKAGVFLSPDFTTPKAESVPVVLKSGSMARDEVFSVQYPGGTEEMYYEYDEMEGNFLTQKQMRAFLAGERDARYYHRGRAWFYSGLAVGLAAGYGLKTSLVSFAVPPVFALTAKIPTIRIRESKISDKSYKYNENYAAGFESYARTRNTIQALKGSAIGTVVGIIAYSIIDNNR